MALARHIQELRPRDTVLLCGSRAAGDYREDSDIDLFVVVREKTGAIGTETAAREWLREHPPDRHFSSLEMESGEFLRLYKVAQSFAGQAVRHGVAMNREEFQWPEQLPYDDPELWETTGMWLALTDSHTEFLERRRQLDWAWTDLDGQEAGWATERGIKALLTALNDPVRFKHGITPMRQHLQRTLDWDTPERTELGRAVEQVLTLTNCDDPESHDGRGNLLAQYIDDWRRERVNRRRRNPEKQERDALRDAVVKAATLLGQEAHRLLGTAPVKRQ